MCKVKTFKWTLLFVVSLLGVIYSCSPALRMNLFLKLYDEKSTTIFFVGEHDGGVECPVRTCPECEKALRELLDSLGGCVWSMDRPPEWTYRVCVQNDANGTWIDATIVGGDVYFSIRGSDGVYKSTKAIAFQEVINKVLKREIDGLR